MTAGEALERLRSDAGDRMAESAALTGALGSFSGLATLAPGTPGDTAVLRDGRLSGVAHRVPWARDAATIVLVLGGAVTGVPREAVSVERATNLAGEPRDSVRFDAVEARAAGEADADAVLLRGALTRAVQMAGALERIAAMSVAHASERHQFGRPIGAFQAVQEHLVVIAQHAALVGVAVDGALRGQGAFEIAAAKLLASRAAITAGRAAHQVHGARGTTREHPLHELTLRLWAWRSEYGDDRHWGERIGAAVAHAGADALYPAITDGSATVSM